VRAIGRLLDWLRPSSFFMVVGFSLDLTLPVVDS